ncbi:MAG: hypothetical protein GY711_35130 [bacterium]|nr:hypothetical protein [bacterium]
MTRVLSTAIPLLIVAMCIAHVARRVWEDTQPGWPAPRQIVFYEWIEQHVREAGEVGRIRLGEFPDESEENLEAKIQHALAPAVLLLEERDLSVVIFPVDADRDAVRAELNERGFEHVRLRRVSNVGLAGRAPLPARADPFEPPSSMRKALGLAGLTLLALLPAIAVGRRAGLAAFFAVLLVAPLCLALAGFVADFAPAPAILTAVLTLALLVPAAHLAARADWLPGAAPATAGPRHRASDALLVVLVLFVVLGVVNAVQSFGHYPEGGVDAVRMYNLRARAILRAPGFDAPFSNAGYLLTTHADYPPLVPYAVVGAYRWLGGLTALGPVWVQSCLWIGGAGLCAVWAARVAGVTLATAMVALFVSPFWISNVTEQSCDVPLAFLFAAALLAWRSAMMPNGRPASALVAGVLLGSLPLVKNEGALLALAMGLAASAWCVLCWHARRGLWARLVLGCAPPLALVVAFAAVTPENDLVGLSSLSRASWDRAAQIGRAFGKVIADPMLFKGVFLVVLPLALLALPSRIRDTLRRANATRAWDAIVTITIAGVVCGYFAVYLVTPHDLDWHLRTSVNRVFAQIFPALALLGVSLSSTSER